MDSPLHSSVASAPTAYRRRLCASVVLGVVGFASAVAAPPPDAGWLDIDQLATIRIVSASKRAEPLRSVPAAVHVITAAEIERSGYTRIPEMLRLAPGVQVARISPSAWAVSSRGFNSQDARKQLVLIDGRSVYTNLFSGVWWDVQDTLPDNIERIEVVRGPGGATWGANAVNGVINVITKSAADTTGWFTEAAGGTLDDVQLGARYGAALGDNASVRVYGRFTSTDDFRLRDGQAGRNGYDFGRGGFRADGRTAAGDEFSLQAELYAGRLRQRINSPMLSAPYVEWHEEDIRVSGGHVLGVFTRRLAGDARLTVQGFADLTRRRPYVLDETRRMLDLEVRHEWTPARDHALIWGVGFRQTTDDLGAGNFRAMWNPARDTDQLVSLFAQDDWALDAGRWHVVGGLRVEHNEFTGWEFQPTLRTSWQAGPRQTFWAAVSRATQTPDRINEFRLRLAVFPPTTTAPLSVLEFNGNDDVRSEVVHAWEAGWRWQPAEGFSSDVTVFWNHYHRLRTIESAGVEARVNPAYLALLSTTGNSLSGETKGVEMALRWQPAARWRIDLAATHLRSELDAPDSPIFEGDSPNHPRWQFTLNSGVELGRGWMIDVLLRHTGAVEQWRADGYDAADVRLAWRPAAGLEFSIVGQNLGAPGHFEAPSGRSGTPSAVVPASWYAKVARKF